MCGIRGLEALILIRGSISFLLVLSSVYLYLSCLLPFGVISFESKFLLCKLQTRKLSTQSLISLCCV